jgi:Ca2+-transporting ATPase
MGFGTNRYLVYAFLISGALQLVVVYVPFLRGIFETAVLSAQELLAVIMLSFLPFVIVEIIKVFKRQYMKS